MTQETTTDAPLPTLVWLRRDLRLADHPALAAKMEVNVVTPEEQAKFAEAAQPAVRALIEETFPDHGIEGEEFGGVRLDADYVWHLDPIDDHMSDYVSAAEMLLHSPYLWGGTSALRHLGSYSSR